MKAAKSYASSQRIPADKNIGASRIFFSIYFMFPIHNKDFNRMIIEKFLYFFSNILKGKQLMFLGVQPIIGLFQ